MDERHVPLFSTLEEDASQREAIDAFVIALAERVDRLQDAQIAGDLAQVRALAELLSEDAQARGFPPLAALARRVAALAHEGKPEPAHEELERLTAVAQRIRLGHRGAL